MRVDRFDYELPKELIAQYPLPERDRSRLMILDRANQRIDNESFSALGKFLRPGDCLTLNDTRVLHARLTGKRKNTDGRWEGLFLGVAADGWEMLCKTRGRIAIGERVEVGDPPVELELRRRTDSGSWIVAPVDPSIEPFGLLEKCGRVPLPPYIRAGQDQPMDRERYQTVYATAPGSIAAPTAGLHFTPEFLARLTEQRILQERVTLHVGAGTFLPIKAADADDHVMHQEWCAVSAETAARLNAVRAAGGRIVAVGTTTARTLETAIQPDGTIGEFNGPTQLFIQPGYSFRAVDALLTNFHLPRSTLLALVSAFAGLDLTLKGYREAVKRGYRFYSYGDAMLIV